MTRAKPGIWIKRAILVAAALTLTAVAASAWAKSPPSWARNVSDRQAKNVPADRNSMEPARYIRSLPSTIEISVGEKQSFRPVFMAGLVDPKIAKIFVDNGVLTIRGLKSGRTTLHIFGGSKPTPESVEKPREIKVIVK